MNYDEAANGREIHLTLNDEFDVSLSETRTAGYRWTAASSGEPVCRILEDTGGVRAARHGGSTTHRWRFRCVAAGSGRIEFRYPRPWERSVAPAKTFILKVSVHP